MSVLAFLEQLAPEVTNLEEEYFSIFSEDIPSQSLGGIDPQAQSIDICINGHDLTIHQSPTILNSSRAGGTTGAVVWKITPLFASWITSPTNKFLTSGIISDDSAILELGCGISAIIGLSLSPLVNSYTLTDQPYVSKLLNQNLEENKILAASSITKSRKSGSKSKKHSSTATTRQKSGNIHFEMLDWETSRVASSLPLKSYDAIIACDCIYNTALVTPLIQTMVDICRLREADPEKSEPTLVIVGQQRRSSEVFEDWLVEFSKAFRIWRVGDTDLETGLKSGSGYLIHVGVLKT